MGEIEEQNLVAYVIPQNIVRARRYFGFRLRNIIEALISMILVGIIIFKIPFVTRVKIIFLIILCGAVGIMNLIGIKDNSLSEILVNLIISQKYKGLYHLRSVKNKPRKISEETGEINLNAAYGESMADKTFAKAKEIIKQFRG